MNQFPRGGVPNPAVTLPAQQPSWFAWISLAILGILNVCALALAAPTLLMVGLLAFESDPGGLAVMALPEFLYVPAQFVLFLPSPVIVLVAAVRRNFNRAYKLHVALMLVSGLILLMDTLGLTILLVRLYVR